jgi:hypothetical protein
LIRFEKSHSVTAAEAESMMNILKLAIPLLLFTLLCDCTKPPAESMETPPGITESPKDPSGAVSSPQIECWRILGTPGFSRGSVHGISISAHNGIPCVSYIDTGLGEELVVKCFVNDRWESLGKEPVFAGKVAKPSMIESNGTPYIVFTEPDRKSRITVIRFAESGWETLSNKGMENISGDSPRISIADGKIYIAFIDRSSNETPGITDLCRTAGIRSRELG